MTTTLNAATCSAPDCENASRRAGLCSKHHTRWLRRGTLDDPPARPSVTDRFWSKVDKRGPAACWPWTAQHSLDGYGRFNTGNRTVNAHRYSYMIHVGLIPEGYHVDHVRDRGCHRRDCVNPAHLEAVPPHVNWERGVSPARLNALKTHCKRGHPFNEANTWVRPKTGGRHCRACALARYHATRARAMRRAAGIDDDREMTD